MNETDIFKGTGVEIIGSYYRHAFDFILYLLPWMGKIMYGYLVMPLISDSVSY